MTDNNNEIVAHIYKECTQFVRHYSNLRFVILTVFLTINSAFFISYTKYQADDFNLQQTIAIVGILVTLIFAIFEYAVAFNVGKYFTHGETISNCFSKVAENSGAIDGLPKQPKPLTWLVIIALVLIYIVTLGVWCYLLWNKPDIRNIYSIKATNCIEKVKNHPSEKSYFIFFETGKSNIQSTQIQTVYEVLSESKCFNNYHIELSGYTDTQGSPSNNKKLAINRTEKVKDYLVRSGILKDKIKFFTKEEIGRPITTEDNIAEKLNRRVEIRIISHPDNVKKTVSQEKS